MLIGTERRLSGFSGESEDALLLAFLRGEIVPGLLCLEHSHLEGGVRVCLQPLWRVKLKVITLDTAE